MIGDDAVRAGCPPRDLDCDIGFICAVPGFEGLDCDVCRLPIEAEGEYAGCAVDARATYNSDFPGRTCTSVVNVLRPIAWAYCNSTTGGTRATHSAAGKCPNRWGCYDMIGNVAEWDLNVVQDEHQAGLESVGIPTASTPRRCECPAARVTVRAGTSLAPHGVERGGTGRGPARRASDWFAQAHLRSHLSALVPESLRRLFAVGHG
ncbi:MAG: hypothetical protein ACJAYU_001717 [Bradymonadia bacterium]|jgi:hypothetical protein